MAFPILLREHELHLRANLPVRAKDGPRDVVIPGEVRVYRQLPEMEDLADAPPSGTVQRWLPLAFQSTVKIGALVR